MRRRTLLLLHFLNGMLPHNPLIAHSILDYLIYSRPIRKSTNIAVVDKDVSINLARMRGTTLLIEIGRLIAVHCIKRNAALFAPFQCGLQLLAFTNSPQNQLMPLGNKHFQNINSKRTLTSNFRVLVFYYCTIKINCNYHSFN